MPPSAKLAMPCRKGRNPLLALLLCLPLLLGACSVNRLVAHRLADQLAGQSAAPEDDLVLAREASAFYLKLSESVLREADDHAALAASVAGGFTQYAYAFVALQADQVEPRDAAAAQALRQRARRLYRRGQAHAMSLFERRHPGFAAALASPDAARWPRLQDDEIALAYWGAAAWGGAISLSKDDPDAVADLPLAVRLASLAYARSPTHGDGALASLMGTFEAARPGGSAATALALFDRAIAIGGERQAGPWLAKAEGVALPAGDRAAFESLLRQALAVSAAHRDVGNEVMRERASWLLTQADDLF